MDLWTFLTIIVLASLGLSAYQAWLKQRRRKPTDQACARDDDIDALMQRVATLESIVTDEKSRLKDEIERL
ncbi:MAG: hypothetical protein OXE81_01120 [Gammaproteobacteria bacterium]|nr:hypothetical protein [Gammaproteobacteria bacterium]MCY4276430.1 hypothetical protein [Gammaproteobacteria bacterium]